MGNHKTFDLIENQDRFTFDLGAYVLGKSVTGVVVEHDRVELYLEGGKCLAFEVNGDDIEISVAVPEIQNEPAGGIN